ncbi:MAG: hypothetical protein KatS3mg057_1241 [Herpetosiphonaceae bacterium]|nr:MAG: hypothetical protein KatS3mg057_1241 [Herpetosiphonaceae bacterium]
MWELEQTERRVMRVVPFVVILVLLLLLLTALDIDHQGLQRAFTPGG